MYIAGTLTNFTCFLSLPDDQVNYSPQIFRLANASSSGVTVVPGVYIVLDLLVMDRYGENSACFASMDLICNLTQRTLGPKVCKSSELGLSLMGPLFFYLTSSQVKTTLRLSSSQPGPLTAIDVAPQLVVQCLHSNYSRKLSLWLNVTIDGCPDGFWFNSTSGMCECLRAVNASDNAFLCDINRGIACVQKGYWVGTTESDDGVLIKAPCSNRHCNYMLDPCPMNPDYLKLGPSNDSQCISNHSGVACLECHKNSSFTFQAVMCAEDSTCNLYALLSIAVVFQVLLSLGLILVLKLRLSIGMGYLYGPLFF